MSAEAPGPAASPVTSLELLTRSGCHLCEVMEELTREAIAGLPARLELVDVDGDPELALRFGDAVPVLLRDGKPVAKVRWDERQLRRIVLRRR